MVGRAVFPTLGAAQQLGDGAAFTGAGFAPLFDQNIFFRFFVGRFAAGADRNELRQRIDAVPQLSPLTESTLPAEIDRLHQVDWLPVSLAILLGGLALFAVGHAIVASVHRRRRELALLKTLGFERRQVRATVGWQATTIGVRSRDSRRARRRDRRRVCLASRCRRASALRRTLPFPRSALS